MIKGGIYLENYMSDFYYMIFISHIGDKYIGVDVSLNSDVVSNYMINVRLEQLLTFKTIEFWYLTDIELTDELIKEYTNNGYLGTVDSKIFKRLEKAAQNWYDKMF